MVKIFILTDYAEDDPWLNDLINTMDPHSIPAETHKSKTREQD